MQKLVNGIHDFQNNFFRSHQELFSRLSNGQSPDVLFITCSDSRIVPNLITQTEPGDLFIIRNAGNIVPPHGSAGGEAATIEYALEALGVKDVIICGHSHCGAMKGLLHPESLGTMPVVAEWLKNAEATRRIMGANYKHLSGNELVTATCEENVLVQLENLRTHPAIAVRLGKGSVRLHGWMYKIETGQVFAYSPTQHQFAPIEAVTAATTAGQRAAAPTI